MRVMRVDGGGEKIVWGSPEEKDKLSGKDDHKNISLSSIIEVVPGTLTLPSLIPHPSLFSLRPDPPRSLHSSAEQCDQPHQGRLLLHDLCRG
jgi:hypothetical protein